jgi:hypothetical protein
MTASICTCFVTTSSGGSLKKMLMALRHIKVGELLDQLSEHLLLNVPSIRRFNPLSHAMTEQPRATEPCLRVLFAGPPNRRDRGSIPGQAARRVWWTHWHFGLPLSLEFYECSILINQSLKLSKFGS